MFLCQDEEGHTLSAMPADEFEDIPLPHLSEPTSILSEEQIKKVRPCSSQATIRRCVPLDWFIYFQRIYVEYLVFSFTLCRSLWIA